jgi:hypothetical protein
MRHIGLEMDEENSPRGAPRAGPAVEGNGEMPSFEGCVAAVPITAIGARWF